jgi:Ca2+-transporting ATPase
LALGWIYPNIFTPVHIIFLEIIMGTTCSIIYENEPTEGNTMKVKPRLFSITFFNWRELTISIVQGLAITLGTLMVYQYAANEYAQENLTRTMVFGTLIAANIFLTLVNRSFYYSIVTTFGYKNNLVGIIILVTVVLSGLLIYVTPLASFFGFAPLSGMQVLLCASTGFVSVIWMEAVKWNTRRKNPIGSAAGAV